VTGLGRELIVASSFGVSAQTDAFNVAFRIPNLLRRLFAEGAFSQAFVPILASSRAADGDAATRGLIDAVATVLFWALVATTMVGIAAAPVLVWVMASGLQAFDSAVLMTRVMFPYICFMSLVALAAGVLNTWRRFALPAATPVLLNLAMIAAMVWGSPWLARQGLEPIYALTAGVMLGGLLQLGAQIWGLHPAVGATPDACAAACCAAAGCTVWQFCPGGFPDGCGAASSCSCPAARGRSRTSGTRSRWSTRSARRIFHSSAAEWTAGSSSASAKGLWDVTKAPVRDRSERWTVLWEEQTVQETAA
jgi:hypothetical protein